MTELLFDDRLYCNDLQKVDLTHYPPFRFALRQEDIHAASTQGVAWRPNVIVLKLTHGKVWLSAYKSSNSKPNSDSHSVFVLPFTVPEASRLYLVEDLNGYSFELDAGQYKLVAEIRFLTDEELLSVDKYKTFGDKGEGVLWEQPELCMLTFIPTVETVTPRSIRCRNCHAPAGEIVLFDDPLVTDDAQDDTRPRTWKEDQFIPKRRRASSWLPYLRSNFTAVSLEEIQAVFQQEPERTFQVEDFMDALFETDMPKSTFLKARNRVVNLLSGGARENLWYSRSLSTESPHKLYSLSRASLYEP